MRSTKRVLTGNLAAASASASLATSTDTPSTSNRMRPGLTRATHNSGVPFTRPKASSKGFLGPRPLGNMRNPAPPRALHVARERAARRLDLARGDPLRLDRLEAVLTERKVDSAGGDTMDAPFVRLAEFGS